MKDLEKLIGKLGTVRPRVLYAGMGVAVLLLFVADYLFILSPQMKGLSAQSKKNTELKTQIEQFQTDKQHIDQFRKGLADMKAQAAAFDRMVYAKDDMPVALRNISTFANEYGVKVDQLVPQKQGEELLVKNTDGTYKSLAILVAARSGYHEFGKLLNRLENEKVFLRLDDLSFSADPLNTHKHLVRMTIRIVVLEK